MYIYTYTYMYTGMCIIESLCHTPDTYMILLINYTSIKKYCKRFTGATRIEKSKGYRRSFWYIIVYQWFSNFSREQIHMQEGPVKAYIVVPHF